MPLVGLQCVVVVFLDHTHFFSFKAWVRSPGWVDLFFRNMVMLSIKENDAYSNMVANSLPVDTPKTPGVGSKSKKKIRK